MRDRLPEDPLAALVALLRPRTVLSKFVSGAGRWAVRYSAFGHPSFCVMTAGSCWLAVSGGEPLRLSAGDTVLLPATPAFRMGSDLESLARPASRIPEAGATAEVRHGRSEAEPAVRMLGGYFVFDSANAPLLVGLLPSVVHIPAADASSGRLAWLGRAVAEEAAASRPGGDAILARLAEIMLIEALRWRPAAEDRPVPGLLAGLADVRLASAIRHVHRDVARRWTIASLAELAGLSRAAFAARFTRVLGIAPMEYVLRWRMALARDLLRNEGLAPGEVAHAIGYQSASAFSVAFVRSVGVPPGAFVRSSRQRGDHSIRPAPAR